MAIINWGLIDKTTHIKHNAFNLKKLSRYLANSLNPPPTPAESIYSCVPRLCGQQNLNYLAFVSSAHRRKDDKDTLQKLYTIYYIRDDFPCFWMARWREGWRRRRRLPILYDYYREDAGVTCCVRILSINKSHRLWSTSIQVSGRNCTDCPAAVCYSARATGGFPLDNIIIVVLGEFFVKCRQLEGILTE